MGNKSYPAILIITILLASCKKDVETVYQVQTQVLYQDASQKTNLKTTNQFISIAYNDVYSSSITTAELNTLNVCLEAFGDQATMEDIIVKNLLANAGTNIPTNAVMRADVPTFVSQTYIRFYNRQATAQESWKMQNLIQQNTDITPQMIYYAMMTGTEYRYY